MGWNPLSLPGRPGKVSSLLFLLALALLVLWIAASALLHWVTSPVRRLLGH